MRQSNKCGSVRTDEIINLHLEYSMTLESAFPAFCKIPVTFIDSIGQNNQPGKKTKKSRNEIKLPTRSFILPWHTYKEPRGPREIDLEPSPKRDSHKINMLKQGSTQKKISRIILHGLTYGSQHLQR